MPVTPDDFRSALARFPSGITVVTSRGLDADLHGITVSAFCSVSLNPPLVLVCIEKTTGSHRAITESGFFVVNILAAGQDEISERFALQIREKFDGVRYRPGIGDIPVLDAALVTLECGLANTFDGGDHTIFLGGVEKVSVRDGEPLVYFHGNYRDLMDG
ncbi:MAG TPA: flavin reductase family protein [Pyrinomonadaceae bacterium]|nr:flavin reductase family protein [Pyrinomonadaceae bacterium]